MNQTSFVGAFLQALLLLIPLLLCLSVHECAHALGAKMLGDSTAARLGRLTLNPLAHADPIGTFALPLMILVAQGASGASGLPLLGWAKPTPVNAGNFTRKISARRGEALVAVLGPISNLLFATLCALGLGVLGATSWGQAMALKYALGPAMSTFLLQLVFLNVGLAVFNLLPLRPLDGESVVLGLLSFKNAQQFSLFNRQFGTYCLWGIVLFGRPLLSRPIRWVAMTLLHVCGLAT